ncbi:MAG TPA: phosphoenolpyruvate carboxylase [Chitinophagaceae bacterium]
MDFQSRRGLQQFKNLVGIKFQLYNSLFTSLPFHRIEKTGILLSLLLNDCEEGYAAHKSPKQIIEEFFRRFATVKGKEEGIDLLFRLTQYIERQVVLFDALEDAAFTEVNDVNGVGTLKHLESEVIQSGKYEDLAEKLKQFCIRLVLTAHPTQFYPGPVLAIINDLARALKEDNTAQVNMYLQQLGKTPFFQKQKPTPYDEAISLVWYLENVFYNAAGRIVSSLKDRFPGVLNGGSPIIRLGFWPGGDRDGNPNVTTSITLKVADALRSSAIKCYYLDVRRLKRRLTFKGVDTVLAELESKLYDNIFIPGHKTSLTKEEILQHLHRIREVLVSDHNGLFLPLVQNLINRVELFGLHFASLDIRQESSEHNKVLEAIAAKAGVLPANYAVLSEEEKIKVLVSIAGVVDTASLEDEFVKDTVDSMAAVKAIHQYNGEDGCNRYIISQCNSALNVLEVYGLFLLSGWKREELNIDIVPLFETIDDLKNAPGIMKSLYDNAAYRAHLERRGRKQTIMVGFSDGTKDGGYLMANWSIYKAKEELTAVSRQYDFDVVFFDGRGGPPARGGGKTHKFYASMGHNISNREIQLTIQGQTVSSSFGTVDLAQYNIEQLLNAGVSNELFVTKQTTLEPGEDALIQELADESYQSYIGLKHHPLFFEYLTTYSPLNFYSETNIGSRPAKRGDSSKMSLKSLRAIPFVGAWSQIKQNVPGYYGMGTALRKLEERGKLTQLTALYHDSLFFKTLVDNCEMAMKKSYFPLTAFLAKHPRFSEIWKMIHEEYELTCHYMTVLTGREELMADYPVEQLSIQMRERIILPLITIQQYALMKMQEPDADAKLKEVFRKLVVRSSFGIINAGRNSV